MIGRTILVRAWTGSQLMPRWLRLLDLHGIESTLQKRLSRAKPQLRTEFVMLDLC